MSFVPAELPPSSDKEFWTDTAEMSAIKSNDVQVFKLENHYLVWEGPHAKCVTCSFPHTIPLDFRKYDLVDGKPVLKLKNKD